MNTQNITEVKITMDDGNTKRISVDENGMILVIGSGPYAGAFRVRLEDATQAELEAADGIIEQGPVPFDEKLVEAANEELHSSQYYNDFEKAVEFLTKLNADEFMELVLFAKEHGNRFPKFSAELRNIVNADDAYCSALIALSRPCGEEIENAAFKLLADCIDAEPYAPVFDTFKRLWKSLKTLKALVHHQVTSLTIE